MGHHKEDRSKKTEITPYLEYIKTIRGTSDVIEDHKRRKMAEKYLWRSGREE